MLRRVWMDTETTKLGIWRRAWDVALIVRDPANETDDEYQWFVHPIDIELERADAVSLEIGGFWERHPHGAELAEQGWRTVLENGWQPTPRRLGAIHELPRLPRTRRARHIARDIFDLTARKTQIYGSNPGFDMLTLEHLLIEQGLTPQWYYHPNDVPNLIEGWLLGRGYVERIPASRKSEDWCRAVGVEPNDYPRHTALGDCQLFRDAFDAMFGGVRS